MDCKEGGKGRIGMGGRVKRGGGRQGDEEGEGMEGREGGKERRKR